MTPEDVWARMTPYEIGVPGREFAEENFAAIQEEAEAREADLLDPAAFILLGQVGRVLKEIQGEEEGGEALHRFGDFLFHAYHFHRAGELLLLADTPVVRGLVEETLPLGSWEGSLPADAGYLQLPRHLVWSHPEPDGPPEDLDGIFWVRSAGGTLSLLAALGIRVGRPGLSVIPLPPVPLEDAGSWSDARMRQEGEGEDFATTLPGGELDRLYSVVTAGEILKLMARIFAYLHGAPESLGAVERGPRPHEVQEDRGLEREAGEAAREEGATPEGGSGSRTRPSVLPFRRIRLVGDGATA